MANIGWAPDYIELEDLKAFLRIPDDDQEDDVQLALAITAASRSIDHCCNRQFGLTEMESRFYSPYYDSRARTYIVTIDDCFAVSGITVNPDDEITDYSLKPSNAAAKGLPYTYLVLDTAPPTMDADSIEIEGEWGWEEIPSAVQNACLLQASAFFSRRESVMGIEGSSEFGTPFRVSRYVEPHVDLMLRDFKLAWAGV